MREVTKDRVTFTIDKKVVENLTRFSKAMRVTKSSFVEQLLIDGLAGCDVLFNSNANLGDAVLFLSKQLAEMKETLQQNNPDYLDMKLEDARNEFRNSSQAKV
mgnify:CR=1 FL=1|jgi:hypothetical protein